jgi:hypothetical protein
MIITFTVGGRAHYLSESLGSWQQVRGLHDHKLIFNVEPGQEDARMIIRGTRLGVTYVNPTRLGVLVNPWHAMEKAFHDHRAEFAILAEEDVVVSDDILEYFGWASEQYAGDPRVRMICAFRWNSPEDDSYRAGPAEPGDFSPLVWGTWADIWENEIRERWDFDYSHKGWDYKICEDLQADGKCIVRPSRSRSQHIGEHGGAHCTPEMFADTQAREWTQHYEPGEWKC